MPTLLLTRPAEASRRFADAWRARIGPAAPVLIAPVVEIRPLPLPRDLSGYEAVILTSANAVAALGRWAGRPSDAWCVGAASAEAASGAGFEARAGGGDAEALIATILSSGARGPLVHLRGREARGDLAARLTAAGIACDEAVVYEQRSRPLSDEAAALLAGGDPVLVPVFSPNSAARLGGEVTRAAARAPVRLAAISAPAAEAWTGPAPSHIEIADRPEAGAMLAALERLAGAP